MDITTATPVEIDTALADIYDRTAIASDKVARTVSSLHHTAGTEPFSPARSYSRREQVTTSEARTRAEKIAANDETYVGRNALEAISRYDNALAELTEVRSETEPFDAEFIRRGGWTRAFLVKNAGGHIHSSQSCSTCNNGIYATEFFWLPQVSGHDETEIVAAAGEGACTVCYPTAPAIGTRTLLHSSEVEAAAARDQRASEKAARAAAKLAKALLPDGSDLRVLGERIGTLSAAKQRLTDAAEWNRDWTPTNNIRRHPSFPVDGCLVLAQAIADKLGTDAETEIAAAVKRAAKRR